MTRAYSTKDMLEEVRSLLDEEDTDHIEDSDIIQSLGRAYTQAFITINDVYPEPLLERDTSVAGTSQEFTLPEHIMEDRLKYITFERGGVQTRVDRVNVAEFWKYVSNQNAQTPRVYTIYGRTVRFDSNLTGSFNMILWYTRELDRLVLPIGTVSQHTSDTVVLTDADVDYSPDNNYLSSYVNVINGSTGEIRSSFQVLSWDGITMKVRSIPARTSVLDRPITSDISTLTDDDYICPVAGTCVPLLSTTVSNFIMQYALSELKREKLGITNQMTEVLKRELAENLERVYQGRQTSVRIQKVGAFLGQPRTRAFWRRRGRR